MIWRARLFSGIPKLIDDHPTAKFLFLTLTVANVPVDDLSATVVQMNKAWHKLIKRKTWPAIGYVRALEITKEKYDRAYVHPHFHAVLVVKPNYFSRGYLKTEEWGRIWRDCLKVKYTPNVDIRTIKPKTSKSLTSAVLRTLSYHVKGITNDPTIYDDDQWFGELFNQTDRIRTVSLGGVIRDYLREDDPEDLIHLESEDDISTNDSSICYYWNPINNQYVTDDKGMLKSA